MSEDKLANINGEELRKEIEILFEDKERRVFFMQMLATSVKDQNCFSDHFKDLVEPSVRRRITEIINESAAQFYVDLVTDAAVIAIEKWLKRADSVSDTEFFNQLKDCIYLSARHIADEGKENKAE